MLREYKLTNFKAFGETVTIPIRPLTLIFGANSSGKSSIFQSLLLLKQTLEEAKNPETVLLPKGSLVDLGTYSDFVHRHETERNFEVRVRFDLEGISDTDTADASSENEMGLLGPRARAIAILNDAGATNAGLAFRFSYDEKKNAAVALPRVDLTIGDEPQPLISGIGGEFAINFESEFWRQWWNNIKEHFDILLKLPYSAKLGEENCSVEKLERILENSHLEDVINDLRGMMKRPPSYSVAQLGEILPEWRDAINKHPRSKDSINDLLGKHLPHVEYKNFIPHNVNLFNLPLERKLSIFNARLRILTNYPTEDGDTSDYVNVYDRDFQEESNQSIREVAAHLCFPLPGLLESLVYLGPLRSQPERYYTFSGDTTDYVGQSGEHLPSLLFENRELVEQINDDLEQLGVKYRLKIDKLQYEDSSPSNVFSLRLVDTRTGIDASLRDVGFGISQVLPIVVQGRLSEKKTLLIEQPEIHLHPAHQAELGDMFIRSAKEQGNTLLLETHSENLILRILRRIRETNDNELPEGFPPIRPEDVAVLYVQPGENGAQVIEIPVTEDGDFARPWPQGFFDERVAELF